MNYYLINNRVMKGGEMPVFETPKLKWSIYEHNHSIKYGAWLKSLQACSITESELEKVKLYLIQNGNAQKYYNKDIIDVTDLIGYGEPLDESSVFLYYFKQPVSETNGVVTFKQQEETNEAVTWDSIYLKYVTWDSIYLKYITENPNYKEPFCMSIIEWLKLNYNTPTLRNI